MYNGNFYKFHLIKIQRNCVYMFPTFTLLTNNPIAIVTFFTEGMDKKIVLLHFSQKELGFRKEQTLQQCQTAGSITIFSQRPLDRMRQMPNSVKEPVINEAEKM